MQVSSGGGSDATWSHDGREVFYIGRNNNLIRHAGRCLAAQR